MKATNNLLQVLKDIQKTGLINPALFNALDKNEQELITQLYNDHLIDEAINLLTNIDVDKNWLNLKDKLKPKRKKAVIPLYRKAYKYAAILMICLAFGFYLITLFNNKTNEPQVAADAIELILENGEKKIINLDQNTTLVKENGDVIGSQNGDVINYNNSQNQQKLVYNTLKVPYGKTINIILSDGSKVYLNAGTTLKYPVSFIQGKNREVFLEGEAFFEVAKDKKHPFIVNANSMNIEVLGTKFNVTSYPEDKNINAVLVEGSVSLSNDINPSQNTLLEPGYKGSLNKTQPNAITLEKVNTKIYTEWMKGDVIFRNASFADITKKLERNYNVTIQNNYHQLNAKKFNASFNKNFESIDDIMTAISKIYPFTYQKTNNNIIINP